MVRGGPSVELFENVVRRFVRFSADRPTLNRIINLEATTESTRLHWLVETHLRPRLALVGALWTAVKATGKGAPMEVDEVWEFLTSYGALRFANAPMLVLLEGPAAVDADRQADQILAVVLPT